MWPGVGWEAQMAFSLCPQQRGQGDATCSLAVTVASSTPSLFWVVFLYFSAVM